MADLIPVQPNLLVNVDRISSVKMEKVKGEERIIVTVDNKNHVLTVSFKDFMKNLSEAGINITNQFWSV